MIAIYDDRIAVPDEAREFVGIERFSQLVFRKRTLEEHARRLFRAAGIERVLRVDCERAAAEAAEECRRAPPGGRVVYLPSCLVFQDREAGMICLRKFAYSDEPFALGPERSAAPPLLALAQRALATLLEERDPAAWRALVASGPTRFHWAENKARLLDLTERGRLIEFLSATFDARSFNRISQDDLLVTKRSSDVAKMRREHRFYEQLEGPLRLFFLQPLAYREGPDWAEYQTERLLVPDVAVQWIHRSFDRDSFAGLLGRLRAFLAMRPLRTPPAAEGAAAAERLYLGKVEERLAQLARMPQAAAIAGVLARCPGIGGIEALLARYRALWARIGAARRPVRQAVSHGDLCFSNILYHRQSQQLKLIDPRGATTPEELWLDELYDLAKLSHSVLGLYDLINHDLVELKLDRDLGVEQVVDAGGLAPLQQAFRDELADLGHDLRLVRLCEASLFLSMVPLHADVPKKVVAFLLTAARIMDELER